MVNAVNEARQLLFLLQTAILVAVVIIGYVRRLCVCHSAAIGGCIAIVPQVLFGFWVFRNRDTKFALNFWRSVYG